MWNVRIVRHGDGFLIQISVANAHQLVIQFKCSFSLFADDSTNEPNQNVINDIDNDLHIGIVYDDDWVKSILFARMDETVICLLEGDKAKLTELGEYLLEILIAQALPQEDKTFQIPQRTLQRTRRRHTNLTNSNMNNLVTLNIGGPNWNIRSGNRANEPIPAALTPSPRTPRTRRRKFRNV